MKFAVCNEMFEGWSWVDTVSQVSSLGYDGIEIAPFTFADTVDDISPSRRREIKAQADDAGLEIVGLHWLLVKPPGLHITSPDPKVRTATRDYLIRLMDFCHDLGGSLMVFGSPNQRSIAEGVDPRDGRAWASELMRAVGEHGAKVGVTLCLEALPPSLTNFMTTQEEAMALAQEIDHPNISTMLDVKSICSEGRPVSDIIHSASGRFRHVHANDANLRGPGFGDTDFVPVFRALSDTGYQGYVSVEVFDFSPDPVTIARESLSYMRSCLRQV